MCPITIFFSLFQLISNIFFVNFFSYFYSTSLIYFLVCSGLICWLILSILFFKLILNYDVLYYNYNLLKTVCFKGLKYSYVVNNCFPVFFIYIFSLFQLGCVLVDSGVCGRRHLIGRVASFCSLEPANSIDLATGNQVFHSDCKFNFFSPAAD